MRQSNKKAAAKKGDLVLAVPAGPEQVTAIVDVVDRVVERKPGPTVEGMFPELWTKTAKALKKEFSNQKKLSDETILLTKKMTALIRYGRDCSRANLEKMLQDLEQSGLIDVCSSE